MPFIIADRVRETSTTTGTGSIALAGAVTGYQSFDAVLDTADTTFYTIADQGGPNWEVGIGTFTAPSTLARTTILSSSNGGSIVNFVAGTKDVFISLPASKTNVEDQPNLIEVNSSSAALRITQTGTGNALVVEDSANPDATPFVVNAGGTVIRGNTSPVNAAYYATGNQTEPHIQNQQAAASFAALSYSNSQAFAGTFIFGRSASNTVGTQAIVSDGFDLGAVSFQGSDGTNFIEGARILAEVDGTPGTNDMPGRLVFSTTADGASSPTERMRIDAAGNVGIGTSAPAYRLDVSGQGRATTGWALTSDGSTFTPSGLSAIPNYGLGAPGSSVVSLAGFAGVSLYTNQTERMRVDQSGNALINTTTAVSRLTVNGDVAGTFFVNPTTVSANYTIPNNYNAMTAGPITVNSGVVVTVGSGSVWTVI